MMRTRYGLSPWIHELPSSRVPAFPRFRGSRTADVVIIGGGMTGCAIAYACAAAGLDTILLERSRIGQGTSGRSAGLLPSDPGRPFREIAAAHGVRDARRVFDAWRHGALEGAALLRRVQATCQLEARDLILVAGRDEQRVLEREYQARADAGLDVSLLGLKPLQKRTKLDANGAMRIQGSFALDPYRACLGLAGGAKRAGAECFEQSPVKRVRFTRRHADVIAQHGTIRAGKVIVATGSATAEYRALRRHFKRRETYFAMTEPVGAAVRSQLGDSAVIMADMRVPPHRIRWTSDKRLLIAGARQDETPEKKRQAVLLQRTGQLMYELSTMYPLISGLQPEYGWEASSGETADGLMYIGPHRNYPHHLFALGSPAEDITGAFVAARILLRAVQGSPEKGDEAFGWTR